MLSQTPRELVWVYPHFADTKLSEICDSAIELMHGKWWRPFGRRRGVEIMIVSGLN
jgi:hypothetical protein